MDVSGAAGDSCEEVRPFKLGRCGVVAGRGAGGGAGCSGSRGAMSGELGSARRGEMRARVSSKRPSAHAEDSAPMAEAHRALIGASVTLGGPDLCNASLSGLVQRCSGAPGTVGVAAIPAASDFSGVLAAIRRPLEIGLPDWSGGCEGARGDKEVSGT